MRFIDSLSLSAASPFALVFAIKFKFSFGCRARYIVVGWKIIRDKGAQSKRKIENMKKVFGRKRNWGIIIFPLSLDAMR